jgi:hypothetical protein
MEYFAGLDVSMEETQVCVVTQSLRGTVIGNNYTENRGQGRVYHPRPDDQGEDRRPPRVECP